MSETRTIPAAATDAEAASQFLMLVVLGLQALAVNGKQAHWNVRGENFVAIHELIDTIVGNAQTGADHAAERIVALGLPIDARVGTVAAKTATRVAARRTELIHASLATPRRHLRPVQQRSPVGRLHRGSGANLPRPGRA